MDCILARFLSTVALTSLALHFVCLSPRPLRAGEEGVERVIGLDQSLPMADRMRVARSILFHDFENRRDRDSGAQLPDSADLDRDGWPDFWEPILAVGFPEYLINAVAIVPDPSPFIPGAYRDVENHALHLSYDGTRVGVRTAVPVQINPALAYEFSLRSRDRDLHGANIRAGIEWMRVDDTATQYLRQDEIPDFLPGQTDWPARPKRLLVNNPPENANAARFFFIIERDPKAVSVAHHGDIWFDDIHLRTMPKVAIRPADSQEARGRGASLAVDIEYSGLSDNIPDPDNPGFFKGKHYSRRLSVSDLFFQPVPGFDNSLSRLDIQDEERHVERISLPGAQFGVYYLNLRIYDSDDRLAVDTTRALAVRRPAQARDRLDNRSATPAFGVNLGAPPAIALAQSGFLRQALEGLGSQQAKIIPWLMNGDASGDNNAAGTTTLLAEEIRKLRSAGIRVTGVIEPPPSLAEGDNLAAVMQDRPDEFAAIMAEAGRRLGLYMDSWQWGADGDDSLRDLADRSVLTRFTDVLDQFAGGLPMAWTARLERGRGGDVPDYFGVVSAVMPERVGANWLWQAGAAFFPWLYEQFFVARGATYPPAELNRLAPGPPADALEARARETSRKGVWLSLKPAPATPNAPDAAEERVQVERLMIDAIYAAALSPETIFLGDLFDPARGLLRPRETGARLNLDALARPTFLASSTLGDMLSGTQYLGRYELLPPFEAHAFRRAGSDQAVIALWHTGTDGVRTLSRADIASGPPLLLHDWAGNSEPLPSSIPVHRVPAFITGMSASMALTRMSVRIGPEPPIKAQTRRQSQLLEVVNHMAIQAPIRFRLRYAARLDDGGMENGWAVSPEELRANLSPTNQEFAPARLSFSASPDPNSPIQLATVGGADKSGMKLAQVGMSLNTSPPADMTLYLRFPLGSDIDVDISELARTDDPHFMTLQMRVRWFPGGAGQRRNGISLMPFYLRKGEMKEMAALPVQVGASREEDRGRPDARYETVELRIPRNPPRQTWVGLAEEGGSNFYLADVTALLQR